MRYVDSLSTAQCVFFALIISFWSANVSFQNVGEPSVGVTLTVTLEGTWPLRPPAAKVDKSAARATPALPYPGRLPRRLAVPRHRHPSINGKVRPHRRRPVSAAPSHKTHPTAICCCSTAYVRNAVRHGPECRR